MAERRRTRSVKDDGDDPDQRPPEADDSDESSGQDEAEPGESQSEIVAEADRGAADKDDADDDDYADDDGAEAEPVPSRRRGSGANGRSGTDRPSSSRRDAALTVKQAAKVALQQIMELTAKPAESITGVERTEDGWRIAIEVIEDRRIPSSSDILATYRAEIDEDGELVSYQRIRRYPRGRGDSSGGS